MKYKKMSRARMNKMLKIKIFVAEFQDTNSTINYVKYTHKIS